MSIGHSFGARILSRAAHSRFMLSHTDENLFMDAVIDFQGAYPVSRFCEKKGNNGGLYTVDIPVKLHAVTSSKYDHAIKTSFWSAGYIGNSKSIKILRNSMAANGFGFCELDDTGRFVAFPENHRKISVDAKAVIHDAPNFFAGAHSDIMDREAGRFIWELMKRIR